MRWVSMCRALEKLKQVGDTSIGKPVGPKKQQKFSIKRAKSAKRIHSATTPHPAAAPMPRKADELGGGGLNDAEGDLNAMMDVGQGGEGDLNGAANHPAQTGLNSSFDSLPTFGDRQESDKTTLNLQKFELARKAAEDESNAIDAEEHLGFFHFSIFPVFPLVHCR